MDRASINVSGADGGGSSVKIYETPDYEYPWRGARVMHGSFCAGPTSPDSQRIEVVELHLPCLYIRVKAEDVRTELKELYSTTKTWREAGRDDARPDMHAAFEQLRSAVIGVVGRHITVTHIETIVSSAFDAGVEEGKKELSSQLLGLLGVARTGWRG